MLTVNDDLLSGLSRCQHLTDLKLSCGDGASAAAIDAFLCVRGPALIRLYCSSMPSLSARSLQHCTDLQELSLTHSYGGLADEMPALLPSLPRLKHIGLQSTIINDRS